MIEISAGDISRLRALIRERMAGRAAPLLVALDGRSGAGKSTLAAALAAELGGTVVPGDDFYAGGSDAEWDRRSPAEKADRVIDWRRLRAEALEPLRAGWRATWRPFDFAAGAGLAAQRVTRDPAPLILLDGVYAARPELADLVDLAILVEAEDAARRRRLLAREGPAFMRAWHARWDSAEEHYFAAIRPRASFDVVITN
jgi:uridine kinase